MLRHRHLVAGATLAVALWAGGCGFRRLDPDANQSFATHTYAHELSGRTVAQITKRIRDDVTAGKQDAVAELVLSEGAWRDEAWYGHAEAAFADVWLFRDIPITLGASQHTLEALRSIAEKGKTRSARVAAAACLTDTDAELAQRVLKAEYADFRITDKEAGSLPPAASDYLAPLGVYVPQEVVSTEEMSVLLTAKERSTTDPDRLRRAADLFNRTLRDAAREGDLSTINKYASPEGRFRLAFSCWEQTKPPPEQTDTKDAAKPDAAPKP